MVPKHRRRIWPTGAIFCFAAMLSTTAGWAGDTVTPTPNSDQSEFEQMIEGELDRLFDHLQGVLQDLPRYALPEVTEDGDIIIRRLPRRPDHWSRIPEDPDALVDL